MSRPEGADPGFFVADPMTAPAGRTLYITTEFGTGLVLTVGALALYFWTRRGEVAVKE
jgi:hypothetical protein